jgi:hypothetical protein
VAVTEATRLRWFDKGATAFAQLFPESFPELGPKPPPVYVCPLCVSTNFAGVQIFRAFPRAAVAERTLTAEHVPPKSFGGKELLLTCAPCNHTAGAHLDSHARKRENPIDAFLGRTGPIPVRLVAGGHSVAADFSKPPDNFKLELLEEEKSGKPGSVAGFRDVVTGPEASNRDVTISFCADWHRPRRAHASWLRSGYLALFAVAGYRYILDPALAIVQKQVAEPDVEHIPTFLSLMPGNPPWSERQIVRVREPRPLSCWAVQIGRYMVFLPLLGDLGFYERIEAARRASSDQPIARGDSVDWPTRPTFGIE